LLRSSGGSAGACSIDEAAEWWPSLEVLGCWRELQFSYTRWRAPCKAGRRKGIIIAPARRRCVACAPLQWRWCLTPASPQPVRTPRSLNPYQPHAHWAIGRGTAASDAGRGGLARSGLSHLELSLPLRLLLCFVCAHAHTPIATRSGPPRCQSGAPWLSCGAQARASCAVDWNE